jgi:F0F1-type ATP synthase assembly protein I
MGQEEVPMAKGPPDLKLLAYYYSLAQVGVEMAAPIGLGAWLDYYFRWTPWLTVTGAVLGFVGGLVHLLALLNKQPNGSEPKNKEQDTP